MPWTIARVLPKNESLVASLLQREGQEAFFPTYTLNSRQRRGRRKRKTITAPRFSGYVFVKHSEGGPPICKGIIGYLQNGDEPAVLSDSCIDELKEYKVKDPERLRIDDVVRVSEDHFLMGCKLIVKMILNNHAVCEYSSLGGIKIVNLSCSVLERV